VNGVRKASFALILLTAYSNAASCKADILEEDKTSVSSNQKEPHFHFFYNLGTVDKTLSNSLVSAINDSNMSGTADTSGLPFSKAGSNPIKRIRLEIGYSPSSKTMINIHIRGLSQYEAYASTSSPTDLSFYERVEFLLQYGAGYDYRIYRNQRLDIGTGIGVHTNVIEVDQSCIRPSATGGIAGAGGYRTTIRNNYGIHGRILLEYYIFRFLSLRIALTKYLGYVNIPHYTATNDPINPFSLSKKRIDLSENELLLGVGLHFL
jgi:hypothetical protein